VTRAGGATLVALALATAAWTAACEDKKPIRVVELPMPTDRQPAAPVAPPPPAPPPPRPEPTVITHGGGPATDAMAVWDPLPKPSAAPQAAVSGAALTRPAKVNPDDSILDHARVTAGSCFATLSADPDQPPQRSAHLVFYVVPTGTVSRVEVSSSDTTDETVLSCLKERAQATIFSDNGGGPLRTYAIDVRVFAPGASGAH
jgi:hypothetical protein